MMRIMTGEKFLAFIKGGVSKFEDITVKSNVDFSNTTINVLELINVEFKGDLVFRNTAIDTLNLIRNKLKGKIITEDEVLTVKNLRAFTKSDIYLCFGINFNYVDSAIEEFFDKA